MSATYTPPTDPYYSWLIAGDHSGLYIRDMNHGDIAAYPEHAFSRYWKKLIVDPHFTAILSKLALPVSDRGRTLLRSGRDLVGSVKSAVDFRRLMVRLVQTVIEHTTEGLSWTGCENIPADRGVCFLSTHRSTSLDPAFVNAVLHAEFGRTAFNAAGDNIFKTRWLGHLIRLNRGFIVRRNVDDIEEKRAEARKLSSYINGLLDQREWVWIAHRNGRSKAGEDRTDSAVLTMLRKERSAQNWKEYSAHTTLVPVSISWELIPLDTLMARELSGLPAHRGPQRDMQNIVTEIAADKKRSHVHFSPPVTDESRAGLVRKIDSALSAGWRLWPSNWAAAKELRPDVELPEGAPAEPGEWIINRADELKSEVRSEGESIATAEAARTALLGMYAAPALRLLG